MFRVLQSCGFLLAPFVLGAAFTGAQVVQATGTEIPAAARSAYQQGLDAQGRQQFDLALQDFQLALKQAGACLDCMEAIATVQDAMDDHKAALATAARMASAAPSGTVKARADLLTGQIYYEEYFGYTEGTGAYEKNPKRAQDALRRAEVAFARAVQDSPTNESVRMAEGHLLASLHRDDDARAAFTACATLPGVSPTECTRALRFAKNVDLARNEPAPPFQAEALDGTKVTLDSLAGKIVLIDFWGTWCPVCRRDADYVQSLELRFPKDRFVLLEVDSGDSRDTWVRYLREQDVKGVQVQDQGNNLQSLFRVGAYPTYVILDGNGAIRMRVRGARGDLRGEIEKLLDESSAGGGTNVASTAP